MSKRDRFRQQHSSSAALPAASDNLVEEYHVIRHDLLRVLIVNLLFLAGVLALFYANRNSLFLERWFEQLVR